MAPPRSLRVASLRRRRVAALTRIEDARARAPRPRAPADVYALRRGGRGAVQELVHLAAIEPGNNMVDCTLGRPAAPPPPARARASASKGARARLRGPGRVGEGEGRWIGGGCAWRAIEPGNGSVARALLPWRVVLRLHVRKCASERARLPPSRLTVHVRGRFFKINSRAAGAVPSAAWTSTFRAAGSRRHARARAHTHTHTHTRTHTHGRTHTTALWWPSGLGYTRHTCARARAHTHTHTHTVNGPLSRAMYGSPCVMTRIRDSDIGRAGSASILPMRRRSFVTWSRAAATRVAELLAIRRMGYVWRAGTRVAEL